MEIAMNLRLKICRPFSNRDDVTFRLEPEVPADEADFTVLGPEHFECLTPDMSWEDLKAFGDLPF